jgi:hypothetical protein
VDITGRMSKTYATETLKQPIEEENKIRLSMDYLKEEVKGS